MKELERLLSLVAPGKRDPHPCATRCFRVGGPVELDARGKCQECGMPTDINTSPTCELPRPLAVALVEALQAASVLRENDRDGKWLHLWDDFDATMSRLADALKGQP